MADMEKIPENDVPLNPDYNSDDEPEMDEENQEQPEPLEDMSCLTFHGHIHQKPADAEEDDTHCVYSTSINAAQNLCISGGHDDHVRFFGITGKEGNADEKFSHKLDDSVISVGWNNLHKSICHAVDLAGNVKVFNTENDKLDLIFEQEIGMDCEWALWHPTMSFLFVGLIEDGSIYMFCIGKKESSNYQFPPRIFPGPGYRATCQTFYDDKNIIVGYENAQINIFSLKDAGKPIAKIDCLQKTEYHFDPVTMSLSNNKQYLAVGRSDGKVSICLANLEKFQVLTVLAIDETEFKEEGMEGDYESQPQSVEFVHFQPNSPRNVLACGCGNGVCVIFELSQNHVRWVKQRELTQPDTELNGFTKAVWMNISGETGATRGGPRLLATGDIKGTIRVWDAAGGFEVGKIENENEENKAKLPDFCLSELGGHEAAVMCIEMFAKCLLTCSEDGTCKIFDLSGEEDRV